MSAKKIQGKIIIFSKIIFWACPSLSPHKFGGGSTAAELSTNTRSGRGGYGVRFAPVLADARTGFAALHLAHAGAERSSLHAGRRATSLRSRQTSNNPVQAEGAARGERIRTHPLNSVGVQHKVLPKLNSYGVLF